MSILLYQGDSRYTYPSLLLSKNCIWILYYLIILLSKLCIQSIIIFSAMGRKKLQQKPSDRTKLILKGNPKVYFKNTVSVDFKVSKKHKIQKPNNIDVILPTFNKDRKYYTSTFVLPYADNEDYKISQSIHNKKVMQSLLEIDQKQIMIPKPRSKNKYCGVCRGVYQDYLEVKIKQFSIYFLNSTKKVQIPPNFIDIQEYFAANLGKSILHFKALTLSTKSQSPQKLKVSSHKLQVAIQSQLYFKQSDKITRQQYQQVSELSAYKQIKEHENKYSKNDRLITNYIQKIFGASLSSSIGELRNQTIDSQFDLNSNINQRLSY